MRGDGGGMGGLFYAGSVGPSKVDSCGNERLKRKPDRGTVMQRP